VRKTWKEGRNSFTEQDNLHHRRNKDHLTTAHRTLLTIRSQKLQISFKALTLMMSAVRWRMRGKSPEYFASTF
jgi:hypothetical protein